MKCLSFLIALATVFTVGCGSGSEGRKYVYPVTGKVTMSGSPLIDASVTFAPKDGQPVAYGRTNSAGEYALTTYDPNDGAAAGAFSVTVSKLLVAPPSDADGEVGHSADVNATFDAGHKADGKAKAEIDTNMVPPEYTDSQKTPLTYTVKSDGDNVFDIEIK